MAERNRGGKDAEIRRLNRELNEAEEQIASLKRRLDREKGPIAVDGATAVRFDPDPADPMKGSLVVGAHPMEQAFAGTRGELTDLFDRAVDAVEGMEPAPPA